MDNGRQLKPDLGSEVGRYLPRHSLRATYPRLELAVCRICANIHPDWAKLDQNWVNISTDMSRIQEFRGTALLGALDVERHVFRAWLEELEPFASRPTKARSPTLYTPLDLLFFVVIKRLAGAGLATNALQSFSKGLYQLLQRPVGKADILEIHQAVGLEWQMGPAAADADAIEIRLPLAPCRRQVLQYTGADRVSGQAELGLLAPLQGVVVESASKRGRRA